MTTQNVIGESLRRMRENRGFTQDQLAGACQRRGWDVSRVTLAKIETGSRAVNDGEIIVLAAVMKCVPGDLLNNLRVGNAIKVVRQGRSNG